MINLTRKIRKANNELINNCDCCGIAELMPSDVRRIVIKLTNDTYPFEVTTLMHAHLQYGID